MADNIGVAENILIFRALLMMFLSILKRQICLKSYFKLIYEIIFSASRSGPSEIKDRGPRPQKTAKNWSKPVITGSVINTLK